MKIKDTALFFIFVSALKKSLTPLLMPFRENAWNLARLKFSLMGLQSIKVLRFLFMNLLGIGLSLALIMSGIMILFTAIFLFATWSDGVKLAIGIIGAIVCLGSAVGTFYYFFASKKWLEIFNMENKNGQTNEEREDIRRGKEHAHN